MFAIVSQLTITLYLYVVKGFVFPKIISTTQKIRNSTWLVVISE